MVSDYIKIAVNIRDRKNRDNEEHENIITRYLHCETWSEAKTDSFGSDKYEKPNPDQ